MRVYKLYAGGDALHLNRHMKVADSRTAQVRYAGHLPNRHFVIPFIYDGASDAWAGFREMEAPFENGDVIHTHLLSVDSRIDSLVFHNKKAAGKRDDSGAITTPAKIKLGLYDGETLVDETDEIDLSQIGRTVLEFGKPTAAKTATKKDANGDGKVNKDDTPTTAISSLGAYLSNHGSIRINVIEAAGLSAACFSAFVELVDFFDTERCSCASEPCEVKYPEPECM